MANPNRPPDLYVVFRKEAIHDPAASIKENRPIYKDIELCEIRFPGDRTKTGSFPAHEIEPNATRLAGKYGYEQFQPGQKVTYAMLYKAQYDAFKANVEQTMAGTPLSELTFLTEARRRELRALNIFTAEQLRDLDGEPLRRLGMGGRELKNQATAWLDRASASANLVATAAKNAALEAQLADMKKQMEELMAAVNNNVKETAVVDADNPFNDWDAEDIKNWIREQGMPLPRGNPSVQTLRSQAWALNKQIAEKNSQVTEAA